MMSESPVKQKCTVKRGPTERFLGIKIRKEHTHKTSTVIVEKENNLKATASLLRKKASNFDGLIKNTCNCFSNPSRVFSSNYAPVTSIYKASTRTTI